MAMPNKSENPVASSSSDPSQLQYDRIGSSYSKVKLLPISMVETFNLHAAIAPFLDSRNGRARVLDLACGTGHYTRKLVAEWGAASVVGVDISPAMVKSAKDITSSVLTSQHQAQLSGTSPEQPGNNYEHKIDFKVGNAITMGKLDDDGDQGFDLVVGAWLLNYARSEDELVNMFRTISSNLNTQDGLFVGIVPPPVKKNDLPTAAKYMNNGMADKMMQAPWRFSAQYLEPLDDDGGWKVQLAMFGDGGNEIVRFETYHLPVEVYERAARKGGMRGLLEWREVKRPAADDVDGEDGELWDRYLEEIGGHFRVLVVGKGASDQ